jgi:hypothetical protein
MGEFLSMKDQPLEGGNVISYMILPCYNIGLELNIQAVS